MPRDSDALRIRKWAASGRVATPESQGLVRSEGWPDSYSAAMGDVPKLEVFNQILREITAVLVEINEHGLLIWDTSITYEHPAFVVGSDGRIYASVSADVATASQDPTTDSARTYWKPLLMQASTEVRGIVELATNYETTTGTDTERAVTSAGARAAGDARYALIGHNHDDLYSLLGHNHDAGYLPVGYSPPAATAEAPGIVELATNDETTTGMDTERAVTPDGLQAALDLVTSMPGPQGDPGAARTDRPQRQHGIPGRYRADRPQRRHRGNRREGRHGVTGRHRGDRTTGRNRTTGRGWRLQRLRARGKSG